MPTFKDAVIKAFEEHFLPHFKTFQCHEWRLERLWQEEIDVVYTRFFDNAKRIYEKFSGKYVQPGSKPSMSHEEFVSILERSGLLNEHFANREAIPLFNLSMMTNIEETAKDRHLNMSFVEFLEALARVADRMELANLQDYVPAYRGRSAFGLDKKLECLLFKITEATLGAKAFKQQMAMYEKKVKVEIDAAALGQEVSFARN